MNDLFFWSKKFSEAPKNEIDALLHIANMLKVATFI